MPNRVWTIKSQKGITGLETAIILIAFVIVASVLSYVVISTGLFSSQKAKAAVSSGLEQTGCTVELKGDVVAQMAEGVATTIFFTVGVVPSGSPVDLTPNSGDTAGENRLTISYIDNNQQVPSLPWSMQFINADNGDNLLDPGELAQVSVDLTPVNTAEGGTPVGPYSTFSLEVRPPEGSVLSIERTIPARVSKLVNLY
jgi:archaeal flagellin FlaB